MFFIELYTLNRAWNGLTDEELLWEPMPGCWTVRPLEKVQTATPFVVGTWAADFDADLVMAAIEGKAIEPLTSIAWLFWHVGSQPGRAAQLDFLGGEHTADSGWTSPYIASHPIFTTAEEAVGAMRAGCARARRGPALVERRRARAAGAVLGIRRTRPDGHRRPGDRIDLERSQPPRHTDVHAPGPVPPPLWRFDRTPPAKRRLSSPTAHLSSGGTWLGLW